MSVRPDSERAVGVAPLIVGVDGSERSRDALALAVQLAEPGQRVVLAHVHPYEQLSDLLSGGDYERLVREVAESTLSATQDTLHPATERAMQLVPNRSPAAGLHDLAAEKDAALIVVGSSHRSGLGRVLAGSVAESVLAGSPVPVAIAPRGLAGSEDSIRIVGCGFDGSREAHEALGWAADIARRRRARLEVLAVYPRIAFGGVSSAGAFGYQSADNALRRAFEKQMRDAIASLGPGVEVSGRLLDGDPATALVDASTELDLLTLGSRGYGPIRTVLLGSVSRALVREGACSVVVLPRGASANRSDAAQRPGSAGQERER
jgi:nucleotide-binding universal stress UspA family protein